MSTTKWSLVRVSTLIFGAAGLLMLSSCMDRHPVSPSAGGPLMSYTATAPTIDGNIGAAEWANATCFEFDVPATGQTTVNARFCAQWDDDNFYWSLASTRPWSQGGDVLRISLRTGTDATLWDEIVWQQNYTDRHRTSADNFGISVVDPIQDGGIARSGAGGATSFEGLKPRTPDANGDDLALQGTIEIQVVVEQGDRSGPSGWQSLDFADTTLPPPPSGNVMVIVRGIPHTLGVAERIAVVARDVESDIDLEDPSLFDVQPCLIFAPGECVAWLNMSGTPVFSAEPTMIGNPADHILWANHRPVEVFGSPVMFEATVFIQDPTAAYGTGSSARKTAENLDVAYGNAKQVPPGGPHTIVIDLETDGLEVVQCTGVPQGTFVYAGFLFNPTAFANIPTDRGAGANSPAIAGYVGFRGASSNSCRLVLASDQDYIAKGDDYDGNTFSGSCSGETGTCNLTPDIDGGYVAQHYIPDPEGDGNPDANYMTFGLLNDDSNFLHWKVNVAGLLAGKQGTSTWEFEIIYRTSATSGEQTLKATVVCNNRQNTGECRLTDVSPKRLANLVLPASEQDGFGKVDPANDGAGYAQILLNVSTIHSGRLRVRSVDSASPKEFVPDEGLNDPSLNIVNGYVLWNKQADIDLAALGASTSLHIPR